MANLRISWVFTVIFYLVSLGLAGLVPTAPGPGESFNVGTTCTIKWKVDMTGSWTNVTIDLMSGSNSNMSFVSNVATSIDGTDQTLTPYSWICPKVDPYSPIYFYQFTNGDDHANPQWTTRFTIASPNGETTQPENPKQPNGDSVPWGSGSLVSGSFQNGKESNNVEEDAADPVNESEGKNGVKAEKHKTSDQPSSVRMKKRPRPTNTSSPIVDVDDVNPTPGLPPPCPTTGSASRHCMDMKLVNKGSGHPKIPLGLSALIAMLCTL